MCGIAGFVGVSKNPGASFKLLSRLFERLEIRGTDASGFYGVANGVAHHHKQPQRSSVYVRGESWRSLQDKNCDILIVHARAASQGPPQDNRNNHPFVNQENTLALIHNGKVVESEYAALSQKYEVESACDSEILMRIVDGASKELAAEKFPGEHEGMALRLMGMKDIFSFITHGHMATAIAENLPDQKRLWLFRNKHRPLWVADMRESLGQVFFCSTPDIWIGAVNSMPELRRVPGFSRHKLYDLVPHEIWLFSLTGENIGYRRFSVNQQPPVPWKHDGTKVKVNGQEKTLPMKSSEFTVMMSLLRNTLDQLETEYGLIEGENSLTPQGYNELIDGLKGLHQDLSTIRQGLER